MILNKISNCYSGIWGLCISLQNQERKWVWMIKTIEKGSYDVIVVGGGIAGVSAAVSASRCGKSVLLIEKQVNLGGLATGGLISWYEPLCDGNGNQLIFGICEELIKLSIKYGFDNLHKKWGGSGEKCRDERYNTNYSPTMFSIMLDKFVLDNGVTLRFDTYATYPVMEGNHCKGVICESVGGREFFEAKVVIDATGDATICHRAGIPTVLGENFMTYIAHVVDKNGIEEYMKDKKMIDVRKWFGVGSDLDGNGHPNGMRKLKGDNPEDVTNYVVMGKIKLLEKIKDKQRNEFDIMKLPTMAQFRTIRHIVGAEDFDGIDGKKYENSIGDTGDFRKKNIGRHYQIPYGALYNPHFDNILACGRIISAPQGDGWEIARVIPSCALTGEAAGKAAAKAIDENIAVGNINAKELFK